MRFPWVTPRTATLEELRMQHAHAQDAHTAATAAVTTAQQAFDDDGSPSAEKALIGARDAERSASEHIARARRLLDAAEARRAAEERAALEAKHDALAAELEGRDATDAKLIEREAAAWLSAVEARAARYEHFSRRNAKRHELGIMSAALGNPPSVRSQLDSPSPVPVAEIIRAKSELMPMGGPRLLAQSVANLLFPWR